MGRGDFQNPIGIHYSFIPETNLYGTLASIVLSTSYRIMKKKTQDFIKFSF